MAIAPFTPMQALTAIALAYRNTRLIADEVLPRVPVGKQEFRFLRHTMAESFTLPDTKVGRKSRPNEVDFSAVEEASATEDYGLEDPVPQRDIDNKPPNFDPLEQATVGLTDLIALDREVRVANLVFNPLTYPLAGQTTLSGSSQWSHADSDPVAAIQTALDGLVLRPNVMVIGRAAFSKLSVHSKIIKAIHGGLTDSGIATKEQIARLFELDKVVVGEGQVNTAKRGQVPSMARVWGKHAALLLLDANANAGRGVTFGFTAEFGTRRAAQRPDPDIGLDGGVRVRVGESVKELIVAPDVGYFFQNAVV